MAYRLGLLLVALGSLAACDDKSEGNNASGEPVVAIDRSADGGGNMSINIPGVNAKISIPDEIMAAGDFDINGVPLFPGSTVTSMHIAAPGEDFRLIFDAPAGPSAVSTWFAKKFGERSMPVNVAGTKLTGATADGDPFTIDFAPAANGHSMGTITMTDKKS